MRESHVSMRESHVSTRESHAPPRESHAPPRESHVSTRESHVPGRESCSVATGSHGSVTRDTSGRGDVFSLTPAQPISLRLVTDPAVVAYGPCRNGSSPTAPPL